MKNLALALVKNATAATLLHRFNGGNQRTAAVTATMIAAATRAEAGTLPTTDTLVGEQYSGKIAATIQGADTTRTKERAKAHRTVATMRYQKG